jgi:hypothetical protein
MPEYTWTPWVFHCDDCGNLCYASVESLRDTHEQYAEEMHHPRELAADFCFCLSCGGYGNGGREVEGERVESDVIRNLARKFAELVELELWGERIAKVRSMNAAADAPHCATHDFCDPNELMAEAYITVVGFEADVSSERDAARINVAWDKARAAAFFPDRAYGIDPRV